MFNTFSSAAISRFQTAHQLSRCLWMTKVVVTLRAGIKEACVPFRLRAVENKIRQGVPVTQSPGRERPSSTAFRHQHRSDPEYSISWRARASRSPARRSEGAALREGFSCCCRPLCVAAQNARSSGTVTPRAQPLSCQSAPRHQLWRTADDLFLDSAIKSMALSF